MLYIAKNGATSQVFRVKLRSSSTGQGLTGLSSASSGLIISTICDNEATATAYTVAGSTIESITTLGTYAAPTATKCRFKEVDATNHPGLYELQLADARFAIGSARRLKVNLVGAASLLDKEVTIQLNSLDLDTASTAQTGDNYADPAKIIRRNSAQAGSAGQITLDASASAVNQFYKGDWIVITGGTGAGEVQLIYSYAGSTKVASTTPGWATTPDNTSTFAILPAGYVQGVSVDGLVGITFPTNFGSMSIDSNGRLDVIKIAGTSQTARDLGASVLVGDKTGFSLSTTPPTAAQVRAEVDSNSTQLAAIKTKTDFLPSAAAGAAGGLLIAGANAATTFATLTSTGAFTINGASMVAQTGDNYAVVTNGTYGLAQLLRTSAYTTPPTAAANRAEMDANSTGLTAIYARQGAPAGASQSADVADVKAALSADQFEGGRSWHVDINNGGDGYAGTRAAPFASIAAAIAVATSRDSIYIAAGEYDEPLNIITPLRVVGAGSDVVLISVSSGSAVGISASGTIVRGIKAISTGTNGLSISGNAVGVIMEDSIFSGPSDGVVLVNSKHVMRRCDVIGTWDGIQLGASSDCLFEDSSFTTDSSYQSGAHDTRAVTCSNAASKNNTFRRCRITATRANTTNNKTTGFQTKGQAILESCIISASASAATPGVVSGIDDNSVSTSRVRFQNTNITTSTVGAGAARDIDSSSGQFYDAGGNSYSTVSGNTPIKDTASLATTIGAPAGASVSADIAAVKSDSGGLVTSLAALVAKFTGITLVRRWLMLMMRSDPDTATRAEVNATNGTATGTYTEVTDSQQAAVDNGGGGALTGPQAAQLTAIKAKTDLIGVGDITFAGPVVDSDDDDIDLVIVRGDDYLDVDGRAIEWTFASCPVLTSGSVSLRLASPLDGSLTTVNGEITGVGSVLFEMDRDETWALAEGTWRLEVQAILDNGDMVQLLAGSAAVTWTLRESVDS